MAHLLEHESGIYLVMKTVPTLPAPLPLLLLPLAPSAQGQCHTRCPRRGQCLKTKTVHGDLMPFTPAPATLPQHQSHRVSAWINQSVIAKLPSEPTWSENWPGPVQKRKTGVGWGDSDQYCSSGAGLDQGHGGARYRRGPAALM